MAISASEARKNLFGLIQQVNDDVQEIEIVSKNGSAVLVSAAEWRSIQETAYLLRSPANAKRLLESIERIERGSYRERELIDDAPTADPVALTPRKAAAKKTAPRPAKKAATR